MTTPAASPLITRSYFEMLAEEVCRPTAGVDRVTLYLNSEASHFIRFNQAAVRQATHVTQGNATLGLVRGRRRIESGLSLTGMPALDRAALQAESELLAAQLDEVSDDPWLLLPDEIESSLRIERGMLPTAAQVITAVAEAARGLDFVGFYAGGPVVRAFADSRGQRHWHEVDSFHFDWCLVHAGDKALKRSYAGNHWHDAEFMRRVAVDAGRLPLLARPSRKLTPGAYRACFSPAAMSELLGALSWSGFSAKSRRTGSSSLMRLQDNHERLHGSVTLAEHTAHGLAPGFTTEGRTKPGRIALIEAGVAAHTLNSPRSAVEYGLASNGATSMESPESLELSAGDLVHADALATLGTGLYVSNLWYLNYSDRPACRMTGMTRYACFWVEGGELVAPLDVMRFDDSFLRMFGDGLVALTDRAEQIPESSTYLHRQLGSLNTPSAVVEGWRLTL